MNLVNVKHETEIRGKLRVLNEASGTTLSTVNDLTIGGTNITFVADYLMLVMVLLIQDYT